MLRDGRLYIDDILAAIQRIETYVADMDYPRFANDAKTCDAVIRNLEIIGEAARSLPDEFKLKYPDAEWKKMSGLRNILVHEYFGINNAIVWDIVTTKLGPLKSVCLALQLG
jgi:uncharacterized protein with HEPN domain